MENTLITPHGLALYPFQTETVKKSLDFMARNLAHGCYVANEQGLGKTITALTSVNALSSKRTLILCPAIMRLVWEAEIYKWCRFNGSVPKVSVIETATDAQYINLSSFVVVSYALAATKKVLTELLKFRWDVLISDENHFCKSLKAKRTQALFALTKYAKYKIFMSGTPMSTNVVDLFVPCHLLCPVQFPSFNTFAERYSNVAEISVPVKRYGHTQSVLVKKYYGLKNAKELSDLIRAAFYIRYKKEDVLKELPPKIFQKIILPESLSVKLSASKREKIEAEKQLVFKALEEGRQIVVPQNLAEHRRIQGEAKVNAIVEFVSEKLEQDIPIVLFAWHHSVINGLKEGLKEFNPVVITGDTPNEERMAGVDKFQSGGTNLFIGNIIAAGTGITLHRCSTVILAELDWVPNNIAQAVDRCHRIGQKSQVIVYWFQVKDSIDERMNDLIMERTKEASLILDG